MVNDPTPPEGDDEYEGLIPVNSRDEIPAGMTDEEAAEFWETHCPGPALFETARRGPFPHGVFSARGLTPPQHAQTE